MNSDGTEYILDDDECPLSILMNHPTSRGEFDFDFKHAVYPKSLEILNWFR